MKLIEKKEIEVSLKKLVGAIKLTTERVQTIAVQAIAYSITKGDASVANMLYDAVSCTKALRKDSVVAYLETMGHLAFDTKTKKFEWLHNAVIKCDRVITPEHEATIMAMRWDSAKPEPEIVSKWDMEEQVRRFLGKMAKIAGDSANTIANRDVLAAVELTFTKVVSEKALAECKALEESDAKAAAAAAKDAARAPKPMSNRQALVQKLQDEALPVIDQKLASVG